MTYPIIISGAHLSTFPIFGGKGASGFDLHQSGMGV